MTSTHSSTAQVYSYNRFSTLEQRNDSSQRRQREFAEKIAEEHGLTINEVLVFSDHGKSASNNKGNFGAFLEAVEAGKVAKGSILIVESFDRLSRENAMRAQEDITALIEKDITIITSNDGSAYNKEVLGKEPSLLVSLISKLTLAS